MARKKDVLGFLKKPRLKSQVNAEYNEHAAHLGHAVRMIREMEIKTRDLEKAVEELCEKMRALDFEMEKATPDPAPAPPEPQAEPAAAKETTA